MDRAGDRNPPQRSRCWRRLIGWLSGRPPARQGPSWRRWSLRALAAALTAYVLLYGPGVRLWSSPPGFDRLQAGTTTVFFQPGMDDEASAVAAAARVAAGRVLRFWGGNNQSTFDFPVDIYLCRSPRRYWHLVMNRAKASAAGNDLLIHASYPDRERIPFLTHELAHLYVVHELGWLRSRLHTPAWLDEGIATSLQGSGWNDRAGLAYFAARTGQLAPLSSTRSTLRWLGAVTDGGDRAGAQYAYVRAFTEDLIDQFGRAAVLGFLTEATVSGDQPTCFASSFGCSLEEAERRWLSDAAASGLLPAGLELVDRGLPVALVIRLLVLAGLMGYAALWPIRQLGRAVRAIAGWSRAASG